MSSVLSRTPRQLDTLRNLAHMPNPKKVTIIGGGPAGLAAALCLKKYNGADVTVYEIRPEPATMGGAISIPPNGLRLLDRLGLYDQLANRGNGDWRLVLHSMKSEVLLDINRDVKVRESVGFGFMRVLRSDIMEVFLQAVQEESIPIMFDKRVTNIAEDGNYVTAKFSDGTSATADMLLGCDGIHSAVRSLHVSPEVVPEYSGIANMYAVAPPPPQPKEIGPLSALHGLLTAEGMIAATGCTASSDLLYWFYSREAAMPTTTNARDGWTVLGTQEIQSFKDKALEALKSARGTWADFLRELIQKTETVRFYPVYKMPATSAWSTNRCLLLGDAAHAMQPHAGQGVSMTLEDAFGLSGLLKHESHTLEEVFQRFEAVRRPRVEKISHSSTKRGQLREDVSPFVLRLKEVAIRSSSWLYSLAGLQPLGVDLDGEDITYDVMKDVD